MAGSTGGFPPWPTVYKRFALWEKAGASQQVLDALRDRVRLADGRAAAPSAAIIDSQSVRAAATVSAATRSCDVLAWLGIGGLLLAWFAEPLGEDDEI